MTLNGQPITDTEMYGTAVQVRDGPIPVLSPALPRALYAMACWAASLYLRLVKVTAAKLAADKECERLRRELAQVRGRAAA